MDNALAQRLIKARSSHGWSQADLAEVSGVAAAQISRYEQGRTTPRPAVVAKLAKTLEVRFEWLAFGHADSEGTGSAYPSEQVKRVEIEMEDALQAAVKRFAQRSGIAYEAVFSTLLREMLNRFERNPTELEAFLKRLQSTQLPVKAAEHLEPPTAATKPEKRHLPAQATSSETHLKPRPRRKLS